MASRKYTRARDEYPNLVIDGEFIGDPRDGMEIVVGAGPDEPTQEIEHHRGLVLTGGS
jgi:hypothetical protein